jgi:hypothetical protein
MNRLLYLMTICIVSACYAGPIAQWHFDESAGQTTAIGSVNGYNGSLVGPVQFVPGGIRGNAIQVERGGYVDMGNIGAFGDQDFSLVAWVKLAANDTDEHILLAKHQAGSGGYLIGLNYHSSTYGTAGKAWFYTVGSPGSQPTSTTIINDGYWHQVVAVYQAGGMGSIYVDGAPVEQSMQMNINPPKSVPFRIGALDCCAGFNGMVDEVQVYNRPLNSDEIQYLYENPAGIPSENMALQFDGIDDFARTAAVTKALPSGNMPYTYELWMKVNQFKDYGSGYQGFILSRGSEGWFQGSHIVLLNGHIGLTHWGSDRDTGIVVDTGKWYHIATTYDGTNERLYVDGVLRWTAALSGLNVGQTMLTLGKHANYDNYYFDGCIDEVRIWNTVRTDDQIAANYNKQVNSQSPNLVGDWHCDEIDGQIMRDTACGADIVLGGQTETASNDPTRILFGYDLPEAEASVPQDHLTFWLKAQTAASYGNGNPVAKWQDTSINHYDVAHPDTLSHPAYIPDAINGQPAVRFDGGDFLYRENIPVSTVTSATKATAFVVCKEAASQPGNEGRNTVFSLCSGSVSFYNRFLLHTPWDNIIALQHGNIVYTQGNWTPPANWDDNWHILEFVRDDPGFQCIIDGSDLGYQYGVTSLDTTLTMPLYVGNDWWNNTFQGDLAEIMVYDKALTMADRYEIRRYLSEKYGIVVQPPLGFDLFAKLASHWLQSDCQSPYWCDGSDTDCNGTINFTDLAFLAENWLQ